MSDSDVFIAYHTFRLKIAAVILVIIGVVYLSRRAWKRFWRES